MATLTITTTPEQDARIVAAFTSVIQPVDENGVPRDVTGAEVKAHLIQYMKNVVLNYERRVAYESADSGLTEIEPS